MLRLPSLHRANPRSLTSSWSLLPTPRRPCRTFSTSLRRHEFHFDTHHFVQRLEQEGLNRAQAEGIMNAMAEVIDESIRNMTSNMVTKAEQEKVGSIRMRMRRCSPLCSISTHSRSTSRRSSPSCSSWRRTISPCSRPRTTASRRTWRS